MKRFAGHTFDATGEAKMRAQIAVWAHADVVKKVQVWNRAYDRNVGSAAGSVTLSDRGRDELVNAFAEIVAAVRREIGGPRVSIQEIRGVLFNEPHSSPAP